MSKSCKFPQRWPAHNLTNPKPGAINLSQSTNVYYFLLLQKWKLTYFTSSLDELPNAAHVSLG
jgi:hypothetical protein